VAIDCNGELKNVWRNYRSMGENAPASLIDCPESGETLACALAAAFEIALGQHHGVHRAGARKGAMRAAAMPTS
jgi:hypothetical protein